MSDTTAPTSTESIQQALCELEIPPFSVNAPALSLSLSNRFTELELTWSGQKQRFVVEYRSSGSPKQIAEAVRQVKGFADGVGGARPMLVAPFLRARQIEALVAAGISAVDLSGNFGIVVPKRWLVMRTGNKNLFPSSAPIKNVYKGVSSLVPRALLTRGSFTSATELRREIAGTARITASTISKVLSSLREELLVATDGNIRVLQPEGILANLSANYQNPAQTRRVQAKLSLDDATAVVMSRNAKVTTTLYAIDGTDRYTVMPSSNAITRIYTSSIASLTADLTLDTDSRFPTVEFIETSDAAPFYGRQLLDGLYRTSRLQSYLELQSAGPRERKSAEQLRPALIAPIVAELS